MPVDTPDASGPTEPPPPVELPPPVEPRGDWSWIDPQQWPTAELAVPPDSTREVTLALTAVRTGDAVAQPTSVTSTNPRFRLGATDCFRPMQPGDSCAVTLAFTPSDSLSQSSDISLAPGGDGGSTHRVWAFTRVGQRLGSAQIRTWLDALPRDDGGFVALARALPGGPLALVRLDSDLEPVTTFGDRGFVWLPRLAEDGVAFCGIAAAEGESVFAACLESPLVEGEGRVTVRKVDGLGALDPSFGAAGIARWPRSEPKETLVACLQPPKISVATDASRVLVGVCSSVAGTSQYHVLAFNLDGTADDGSPADTSPATYFTTGDLTSEQRGTRFLELRVDASKRLYVSRGPSPGGAASVVRFVGGEQDSAFTALAPLSSNQWATYRYLGNDAGALIVSRADGSSTGIMRFGDGGGAALLDLPLSYWGHDVSASGGRALLWADAVEGGVRALRVRALAPGGFDPSFAGPAGAVYALSTKDVTMCVANAAGDRAFVGTGFASAELMSVHWPTLTPVVAGRRLMLPDHTGATSRLASSISDTFAASSVAEALVVQRVRVGFDGAVTSKDIAVGANLLGVARAPGGAHVLALSTPAGSELARVEGGVRTMAYGSGGSLVLSGKYVAHAICGEEELYAIVRDADQKLSLSAYDAMGIARGADHPAPFTGGGALAGIAPFARAAAIGCVGDNLLVAVAEADSSGCGALRSLVLSPSGEVLHSAEGAPLCAVGDALRAQPHPLGQWLIANDGAGARALVFDAAGSPREDVSLGVDQVHDALALSNGELLLLVARGGRISLDRLDAAGAVLPSLALESDRSSAWRFAMSEGVVRVAEVGSSGVVRMTALPPDLASALKR